MIDKEELQRAITLEILKTQIVTADIRIFIDTVVSIASRIINGELVEKAGKFLRDEIFINHIKTHLGYGGKIVCKICGKSADEIIEKEGGIR